MPKTWWGNAVLGVYLLGYVYFVIDAGVRSWPFLGLFEWWRHMGGQAMFQTFWPLWVVLRWCGVQLPPFF